MLCSIDGCLPQKALAQNNYHGNYIVKSFSSKPSYHHPLNLKASPSNPANTGESLIRSFLYTKSLLSSAVDQIRNSTIKSISSNESSTSNAPVVWNYNTLLLSRQIIPPKDFLPLFSTLPHEIMGGYVTAKLPCDANSISPLKISITKITVGETPDFIPVRLQLVNELSKPAYMCVYHARIQSTASSYSHTSTTEATGNLTTMNIELLNPTTSQVVLPYTSSISIMTNEKIYSDYNCCIYIDR